MVSAVRTADHQRPGRTFPIMIGQDLFGVQSKFSNTLARFVVTVLRPVDDGYTVPTLIAAGESIAFLERHGFERSGAQLSA